MPLPICSPLYSTYMCLHGLHGLSLKPVPEEPQTSCIAIIWVFRLSNILDIRHFQCQKTIIVLAAHYWNRIWRSCDFGTMLKKSSFSGVWAIGGWWWGWWGRCWQCWCFSSYSSSSTPFFCLKSKTWSSCHYEIQLRGSHWLLSPVGLESLCK